MCFLVKIYIFHFCKGKWDKCKFWRPDFTRGTYDSGKKKELSLASFFFAKSNSAEVIFHQKSCKSSFRLPKNFFVEVWDPSPVWNATRYFLAIFSTCKLQPVIYLFFFCQESPKVIYLFFFFRNPFFVPFFFCGISSDFSRLFDRRESHHAGPE